MDFMQGVRVFTPAKNEPQYQISADCLANISNIVKHEMSKREDIYKAVARKILQDVEDIAQTGQLDSVEEICEFLQEYYDL